MCVLLILADDFPSSSEVLDASSSPDPFSDQAECSSPHDENLDPSKSETQETEVYPASRHECNYFSATLYCV